MWDYISSKPAIGIFDVNGAFDSHTLPPIVFIDFHGASYYCGLGPSRRGCTLVGIVLKQL